MGELASITETEGHRKQVGLRRKSTVWGKLPLEQGMFSLRNAHPLTPLIR